MVEHQNDGEEEGEKELRAEYLSLSELNTRRLTMDDKNVSKRHGRPSEQSGVSRERGACSSDGF
jgi:hypothetical protein